MSALYDAFIDLANAFEARESGPAHMDRTADGYHVTSQQLENEEHNQRAIYDASDLAEELDEVIVHLLKEGDALEAGTLLTQRMEATIKSRAAWNLAP